MPYLHAVHDRLSEKYPSRPNQKELERLTPEKVIKLLSEEIDSYIASANVKCQAALVRSSYEHTASDLIRSDDALMDFAKHMPIYSASDKEWGKMIDAVRMTHIYEMGGEADLFRAANSLPITLDKAQRIILSDKMSEFKNRAEDASQEAKFFSRRTFLQLGAAATGAAVLEAAGVSGKYSDPNNPTNMVSEVCDALPERMAVNIPKCRQ